MNSCNSSLLDSSSIFIKLSEEELTQQNVDGVLFRNITENTYSDKQVNYSHNYQSTELIQMTQEEALRLLNLAASLLQANIKRYFQQRKYKEMLKEHKAAVKIQAFWKGYRTRCLDVGIQRKKLDYVTNCLQNQLLQVDEKYARQINSLKSERISLIEVLLKLINNIDGLSTLKRGVVSSIDEHIQTENFQQSLPYDEKISVYDEKHSQYESCKPANDNSYKFKIDYDVPISNGETHTLNDPCESPVITTENIHTVAQALVDTVIAESIKETCKGFQDTMLTQGTNNTVKQLEDYDSDSLEINLRSVDSDDVDNVVNLESIDFSWES